MRKIVLKSHNEHSDKTVIFQQTNMRFSSQQLIDYTFLHLDASATPDDRCFVFVEIVT